MDGWRGTAATTSIFVAASITDWLDGYLARKVLFTHSNRMESTHHHIVLFLAFQVYVTQTLTRTHGQFHT